MDYEIATNDSWGQLHTKTMHPHGIALPISIREKKTKSNT